MSVTRVSSSIGLQGIREVVSRVVGAALTANPPISPSSASSPTAALAYSQQPPMVFQLEVADGCRGTMLRYAKEVFDASAAVSMASRVDVVPLFPSDEASTTTNFVNFSKSAMTKQKGFEPQFGYIAMGGTFDHLHSGHKLLLLTSASFAVNRLRIGVTSAELLAKKKFSEMLEPYDVRKAEVIRYVSSIRADLELEVAEINDMAGGTDKIPNVEALVVSPETLPALEKVNEMRAANGFKAMELVQIPYIGGDDDGSRVSSTKLRQAFSEKQQSPTSAN